MSDVGRGAGLPAWKLEDAKARFSELVRVAREKGAQRVTVRGQDAVVVLSMADYARLAPAAAAPSLAALFDQGPFTRLDDFDPEESRDRPWVRDPMEFEA